MLEKPAILGGTSIFKHRVPIVSPALPALPTIANQIEEILQTGMITNFSKYSRRLEASAAEYLGVRNCITLSNGTTGLLLMGNILNLKGEIIVPSFTYAPTVHAIMWNGLTPVFVDIDHETYNIIPSLIEEALSDKTTGIFAVHIFGNPCDVVVLEKIAKKYELKLIFDAAHAFGSIYQGTYVGGFGDAEVFSLSATKTLVAGEGGLLTTNSDEIKKQAIIARNYGLTRDNDCPFWGLNGKMPEFNAILALNCLEKLEQYISTRNEIAKLYKLRLGEVPGISFQKIGENCRSTFKDFAILIDKDVFGLSRDQLGEALEREKIESKKYFFPPVHRMKVYADLYEKKVLLNTDFVSENILCLPIYSHMTLDLVEEICFALRRIQYHCREISRMTGSEHTLSSN